MTPTAAASPRTARSRAGVSRLVRWSRCRSNSRPMTAATRRTTTASWGKLATRRRISARTSSGIRRNGILGRLVEAPERVVRGQQANNLSEEEGVAAGDLVQSRDGLMRRLRPGDGPDVGLEVRRRQPAKRDPCSDPGELGEDVTELADPPLRVS